VDGDVLRPEELEELLEDVFRDNSFQYLHVLTIVDGSRFAGNEKELEIAYVVERDRERHAAFVALTGTPWWKEERY
jgi:hypothetical protein